MKEFAEGSQSFREDTSLFMGDQHCFTGIHFIGVCHDQIRCKWNPKHIQMHHLHVFTGGADEEIAFLFLLFVNDRDQLDVLCF